MPRTKKPKPKPESTSLAPPAPAANSPAAEVLALAGPALKGGEMANVSPSGEVSALGRLTANWRSVVEDNVLSADQQADRKRGQRRLDE
jgi:hypothetical protein